MTDSYVQNTVEWLCGKEERTTGTTLEENANNLKFTWCWDIL